MAAGAQSHDKLKIGRTDPSFRTFQGQVDGIGPRKGIRVCKIRMSGLENKMQCNSMADLSAGYADGRTSRIMRLQLCTTQRKVEKGQRNPRKSRCSAKGVQMLGGPEGCSLSIPSAGP